MEVIISIMRGFIQITVGIIIHTICKWLDGKMKDNSQSKKERTHRSFFCPMDSQLFRQLHYI